MNPKNKSSNGKESGDSSLSANNNPDLEEKVDAMLSLDEEGGQNQSSESPSPKENSKTADVSSTDQSLSGAPLLPSDKLPTMDSSKAEPAQPEPVEPPVTGQPEPEVPSSPAPAESADTLGIESDDTNKAVDEIVAEESDTLLEAQDKKPAEQHQEAAAPPKPPKEGGHLKRFFSAWWHKKAYRNSTIAVLLLAVVAAIIFPTSRYFVLNAAGVRSAASIVVLDQTTNQPLKNAEFTLGGQTSKTDSEGYARLEKLKLGKTELVIHKPAFAEIKRQTTVGWGSNPLGEHKLTAVGSQYQFVLTDFLSDKPVAKAEAASGLANARSDENGEIVLTVEDTDKEEIEVEITAEAYRTEKLTLPIGDKEVKAVKMVPARKQVFISNRSGTYDVYKIDVDGKNEEKVLAGTGHERADTLALTTHPTKDLAALVSTRDNVRNSDGFMLSSLILIDLTDNTKTKVNESERIQLIDWIGNQLVYVKIDDGASKASPDRHRLLSYNTEDGTEKELYRTNYFNDITAVGGSIYYTPSSYNVNGSVGLYKVSADGSNKKTVYDQEVWNLLRTSHEQLSVSQGQNWFDLDLSSDIMSRAEGAPPNLKSRVYVDNSDRSKSLWVDERDGKGVLLVYEPETGKDTVLQTQSGLKNPVRWLTDSHVVYRISTNEETADYVINVDGGEARKIGDVTNTAGIDRWYYY